MPHKNSEYSKDWFEQGDKDLNATKILLEHSGPVSTAATHIQQAVEKYLKGYLLFKGWKLKRTHNLVELLDFAIDYDQSFEQYRKFCEETTAYYLETRYPIFKAGPKKKEVEEALETAKSLVNDILKKFERLEKEEEEPEK